MLSAALLWLLNHYEAGTNNNQQLRGKVIARIEEVLEARVEQISVRDMLAFRRSFPHTRTKPKEEENDGD